MQPAPSLRCAAACDSANFRAAKRAPFSEER
jgi:hypothetical protein